MLEINEESLHNKLLEHKNHIGFNCAEGSLIIASGLAFVYTIVSGKINNNILNIVSWCFAIGQIIYGLAQVIIALKTKFNAEKLYREIVKLDVSAHRYSLIAIKDSFMGYKSNRILTKYFEGKWNEYMFLSFPTAAERDEESLKNAIGAALKIPRDVIHLYQKASIYQPKISQDWNTVRAYYNTYYVVYIDSFPELLKNNEFEIDGVHYKWMTLEQMEREAEKKEHNKNERRTFARYIFTPARYTDLYSEPRKNVWKMPHNVCIRLNRKCDLSCKFCLACSENTLMLSTDVVKQCLCLLKNNGVRRARLGGGEPTRHPGFMEIVRYSVNLGMDTIVYSNLYDVDKIIPELIKYPIRVVTSLHGDESFHDFITQTEGAYQRKDKAFIEKLKEKYNVQTEFIPSIRVTSGNCAEHTGISATEYKRLTGKQVHLKNDEIYVVYQWDRSEYGTIGLDFGKLKPRLYTGCATADIWIYTARTFPGNKFTRKYTIKGNDRRIITGNFKTRVLSTSNMNTDVFEDIIVFSDHEYDKISQKAKGSNLTVLMNVAQNYDAVVNKIANYAAKHSQINFFDYHDGNLIYDKKPCTIENQENRMLNVSAMLIDMLVLFISIIFILLEKISSDYEALEWKYLFYYRTGMPEKKRRKNIYKEITMTSKVALITGMFIAAVMILVKILYKKMPVYWTKIYLAEAVVMIIGMTAIIMIIVRIAAWRSFKRSERRNKDE